jgi:hypothetical protein
MADEITVTGRMLYSDSESAATFLQILELTPNVATKKFSHFKVSVGTSEEALPLGEATSPGWCLLINRDATNYVEVKTGTGGVIFGKMLAGEFCLLRLGSGAAAPYAIANTAACQVEGLIVQT